MIASPLEEEHAARIAAAFPAGVELIHRPDLLPPTRYQGDHGGEPGWRRSASAQAEWRALLARAEVLFDLPVGEDGPTLELCPRLRWVQTTSAGSGRRWRGAAWRRAT
jgi:hypothetical protein